MVLVVHGVNVVTLLVGQHGSAWNGNRHDRLDAFDQHGDEFAIDQRAIYRLSRLDRLERRVGYRAAHQDRVGGRLHAWLDVIDLAGLVVQRAIRQTQPDHHGAKTALCGVVFFQVDLRTHRDREQDIYRVLADDAGERAGTGSHNIADADRGSADLAADRRMDLGIGQIDLCHAKLRLGRRHLRGKRALVGGRVVHGGALPGRRAQQRLGARQLDVGVRQLRAGICNGGFLLRHGGLERLPLQSIQQIALMHLGPFDEQPLLQERGHASGEDDAINRLDAAGELGGFRDRLLFGAHHPYCRRTARRLGTGLSRCDRREHRNKAAQVHP